ncbi:MAG: GtrA family protein [Patescibacteria group bacterium]
MPVINRLYLQFKNLFSTRYPGLFYTCEKRKSVIKFFFAGSTAALVDLVFLFLFHGIFKWNLVLSTSLAFILSFAVSFTLQKFWTFRNYSQKRIPVQFVLYIGNAFIGLNINGFLMHLLANKLGIWYLLAQVIVNVMIGVYNFFVYKFIVFRTKKDENNCSQETITGNAGNLA